MIKQAEFITSAANKSGWIKDDVKEILFVGRSNVGKSSFINALTNNKHLAKVAGTPGKTRLLNFFSINKDEYRIVDAPGYGYAKIPAEMIEQFGAMMDDYITNRDNLKLVVMLVDLRHKPSKDDVQMYDYFKHYDIPVILIGTKLDKLKKNDIKKNEKLIKDTLEFRNTDSFFKVSNTKKENINQVELEIRNRLGLEGE